MTIEEGVSKNSITPFKALQLGRQNEIVELLSEGFCSRCKDLLQTRFEKISYGNFAMLSPSNGECSESLADFCSVDSLNLCSPDQSSTYSGKKPHLHQHTAQSSAQAPEPVSSARHQMNHSDSLPPSLNHHRHSSDKSEASLGDEFNDMSRVRRKKDFEHFERIKGRPTNIVKGLELHTGV